MVECLVSMCKAFALLASSEEKEIEGKVIEFNMIERRKKGKGMKW